MRIYMTFEPAPEPLSGAPAWPWHAALVALELMALRTPSEGGVVPLEALTEAIARARERLAGPPDQLPSYAREEAAQRQLTAMLLRLEHAAARARTVDGATHFRWREDF